MSVADQNSSKPQPIHALTGMRFFAALVVVVVHSIQQATGTGIWGPLATNAVTFFFVLSGFILTYVYHERIWQAGIAKFYVARFARVWPLHVACFALIILVTRHFSGSELLLKEDTWQITSHLTLVQSWIPLKGWAMRYNGPAWSISTEFGFYLLFPLLLLIARRGFGKLALGCLGVSVASVVAMQFAVNYGVMHWPIAVEIGYINPIVRAFDFAVGMWIASIFLRRNESLTEESPGQSVFKDSVCEVIAFSILAFLFYQVNYGQIPSYISGHEYVVCRQWLVRGGGTMPGFIAMIWVLSWSNGLVSRLLSKPLIVYLGEISFALYLVQMAVLELMTSKLGAANLPVFYFVFLTVTLCVGISMLLFALVEMPLRQFLVAFANFNWRKVGDSFLLGWRLLAKNGVGLISVLICTSAVGLIFYESRNTKAYAMGGDMIRMANELHGVDFQPVVFEKEATLHWLEVVDNEDTVDISMWWQIDNEHRRVRFMHFCDVEGNILNQGYTNTEQFTNAAGGSFVMDKVKVKKVDLVPGVQYIGVGFWGKGIETSKVLSGMRQMNDRRLLIGELTPDGIVGIGAGYRFNP